MNQYELFERVRAVPGMIPWERVLAFRPDGAKSATQKAIEHLGMLQGVTVREVQVAQYGVNFQPHYVDQFGQEQPALSYATMESLEPGSLAFEVLDGRRRAQDSYEVGDKALACNVLPMGANERTVAAAAAVLNIARKPNPLQEAQGLQRLIELGLDREQIADTLGIPLQTIKKRLRLLSLPMEFQQALAGGAIKPGVAERIANLQGRQVHRLKATLQQEGSVKGHHVREVQEAHKQQQAEMLLPQLDMQFTLDPDQAETEAIVQHWDALKRAARALIQAGTSFTQIRRVLSDINRDLRDA